MTRIDWSRGTKRKKPAQAQDEAATIRQRGEDDVPVIVELRKEETFNSEVFISMFSGQIYDVLVSSEEACPDISSFGMETQTDRLPLPADKRTMATFSHLLPHLAAVTAKKQGRRNVEKIQLVTEKSPDLPLLAQPDFGFKLAGSKYGGGSGWILPGKLLTEHDEFHSSNFNPKPDTSSLFYRSPAVPSAIAWALREPAAWALASNNPWVFTHSGRELVILRFYKIPPEDRVLPAVHDGEVRVGASYFAVPALHPREDSSTAWEYRDLFALPWYRDAPAHLRRSLSYHLGLWVALMARLCTPDEPVGTGPPPALNSWYLKYDRELRDVHEARYSTAFRKALVVLEEEDARPYSVVTARRKARHSQHDRECEAMAELMHWRPDSPVESDGEGEERPRKKMKCRLVRAGHCAQLFHDDDGPWITK